MDETQMLTTKPFPEPVMLIAALATCLEDAWVDYDTNPFQMATDEYDAQEQAILTCDDGTQSRLYKLGKAGAAASVQRQLDLFDAAVKIGELESKIAQLSAQLEQYRKYATLYEGLRSVGDREGDARLLCSEMQGEWPHVRVWLHCGETFDRRVQAVINDTAAKAVFDA